MTVRPWQTRKKVQSSLPLAGFVTGCDGRVAANYRRCHAGSAHVLQNTGQRETAHFDTNCNFFVHASNRCIAKKETPVSQIAAPP